MASGTDFKRTSGFSLIEVLVTLLILSIGLLGIAALQSRLHLSEAEAYQRAQALILLQDMESRLAANRNAAASYVTGASSPLGVGVTCPTSTSTRQQMDSAEWCQALQGAAETSGTSKVGGMIGGRGCIESIGSDQYLITVAWQGLSPLSAPPTSVGCGRNSYNGVSGSTCASDMCRRTVTAVVRVADL